MLGAIGNVRYVFSFYVSIVSNYKLASLVILISGFFSRILGVLAFASVIKLFLVVINPEVFIPKIVSFFNQKFDVVLSSNESDIIFIMLLVLQCLLVTNYIVDRINIAAFLRLRWKVTRQFSMLPVAETKSGKRNFSLDVIPNGCESLLKIAEIVIFFILVGMLVFLVNALVGLMVILLVPFFILYMVFRAKKDLILANEFKSKRGDFCKGTTSQFRTVIEAGSELLKYRRTNNAISQLIAGTIISIVIFTFFVFGEADEVLKLWSIVLVFGIRFLIGYAKELSVHTAKILAARAQLKPLFGIDINDFREITNT